MVSVEPTARGLQTLCPSEPCDLIGKAPGVTDRRMGESARGGRRVGISGSRLWARVGRPRQKTLETTEGGQGMKRRPRAFLCLPSSSGPQLSSRAPPPAPLAPRHCRGLARAGETWEPSPLPTTPTVLESGEQMALLAKQLVKQTVCFRAFFFEVDFVVGVGRCVYR